MIAKGQLEQALELLNNELEHSNIQGKNETLLQSFRYYDILKEVRMGKMDHTQMAILRTTIVDGVLMLLDDLEETTRPEQHGLNQINALSTGAIDIHNKISLSSSGAETEILHLRFLFEIHKKNLQWAEAAAAKFGDLTPPIILHQIDDNRQKIEEIEAKINAL